ncbi:MAG: cupin domain-containing protein [Betaproteobacteria bacterium]|nr:cupin domain-containing protein [Betaproteobacteria bacterium]MDE2623104.1 cupin domain-containing protein [Betaproteobacteria bacterium]
MKRTLTHYLSLLALMGGFIIPHGLSAQTANDTPSLHEQKSATIPEAPNIEVIASRVEFKPGEYMKWHYHHGIEVIYVIQGADVQLSDTATTTFKTGTTLMIPKGVRHEGFKVIGHQTLKLFLVHIVERNKPLFDQKP